MRTLFACIPAAMLAACGGDGTTPPAPPVATAPDAAWTSRCGQSPQPAAGAHYLGVTPDGAFGTWTFDTQALVSHYTVTDGLGITTHGTSTLHRDAATCSYIAESTGALRRPGRCELGALSESACDSRPCSCFVPRRRTAGGSSIAWRDPR